MTGLTWLALAGAALLTPAPDARRYRASALREHGRLATVQQEPVIVRPRLGPGLLLLACGVLGAAVVAVAGPVIGAAVLVASGTIARLLTVAWRGRQAARREAELCAALRLLAAELDAGSRPGAAFAAAADACPEHRAEFTASARACAAGRDPPLSAPALRGLAQAWSVAVTTGAPMADVVRRVADDVAARLEQRRGVSAAVAGARSSALLLAGLPVLGLLLGAAMQARPLEVLLRTPAGQLLGLVGVTLDALGVLWTQFLIARSERA
jgi:tight adherence protein B